MLNKRPIFIVGFARGGTNILLNWLRSHPGVCSPRGETQEVFKGQREESVGVRVAKILRYLPILAAERQDIFSLWNWADRPPWSDRTRRRVDATLFADKLRARNPDQNLYKCEGEPYTLDEIRDARILCKNLNGLIFLSREFAAMYPDATFIALVRDGFAVCEGHIRRGTSPQAIATSYHAGCQRILADARTIDNFHIVRYEDIVAEPRAALERVCRLADLDVRDIKKVRVQHKPVIDTAGRHTSIVDNNGVGSSDAAPQYRDLHWYDLDSFGSFFRADINENQRNRLSHEQKQAIEAACRDSLEAFGYL